MGKPRRSLRDWHEELEAGNAWSFMVFVFFVCEALVVWVGVVFFAIAKPSWFAWQNFIERQRS